MLEAEPRSRHQVFDGPGDQNLVWTCKCGDPRTNVNGNTTEFFTHHFALTCMNSGPDLHR